MFRKKGHLKNSADAIHEAAPILLQKQAECMLQSIAAPIALLVSFSGF
jgi:hypothetical protein